MVKEFISAALPWVILGISLAVTLVSNTELLKAVEAGRSTGTDHHGAAGMCLGMAIGLVVGLCVDRVAIGLTAGMLLGQSAGVRIRKGD